MCDAASARRPNGVTLCWRHCKVHLAAIAAIAAASTWALADGFASEGRAARGGHVHDLPRCGTRLDAPIAPPLAPPPIVEQLVSVRTRGAAGCDDGSEIDLLVVYTAAARTAAGGTPAILSRINQSVTEANAALSVSLADYQIVLVHTAEIPYTETGDSLVDGPRLLDPNDGFLDEAHVLREQYAADVVALWVENIEVGGRVFAPITPSGSSGFHIMRQDNYGLLTLAHELGHNLGLAHDRENAFDDAYFEYAYGYRAPGAAFRTIMAYAPGTPIDQFANPNLMYMGQPTGVPAGSPLACDTVLAMNQTRHIVSNYRRAGVSGLPAVLYVRDSAPPGGDGTSWATAFNDLQEALCQADRSRGDVQQIWVAAGFYTPDRGTGLRQMSFRLADGLAIYGGFSGTETMLSQRDWQNYETVLSGDIGTPGDPNDNSQHVVVAELVGSSARLDGFTIWGGSALVDDLYFAALGGGLRCRAASPTIANCAFNGNRAVRGGGMSCTEGSAPLVYDCVFSGNLAEFLGGALQVNASSPVFDGVTFYDNDAEWGGGTSVFGGSAVFDLCVWLFNRADSGGGGAHNEETDATYNQCEFVSNQSPFAGAMRNLDASPELIDCLFEANYAPAGTGGAVTNDGVGTPVFDGCTFLSNSADWSGAMSNYAISPTLISCQFSSNVAVYGGGAMISGAGAAPSATNCVFTGNSADFGGAVYHFGGANASYSGGSFTANFATGLGGAVYNYDAAPQFTGVTFSQNESLAGSGGAVSSVVGSAPTLRDCLFVANTCRWSGGAVFQSGAAVSVLRCAFADNTAEYGGAVANTDASASRYVNSVFLGNIANWSSGAADEYGNAVTVYDGCAFSGNVATISHGGASAVGGGAATTFNLCTLSRNAAGFAGGGVASDTPGAIIRNSILWGNSDPGGMDESAQIHLFSPGVDLRYSTVQGLTGALGGVGNDGNNPLLADADGVDNVPGTPDDDLHLLVGSPAIDAAENPTTPTDALDADGDANTAERLPLDVDGAPRFSDDPAADTGVGPAPIADRGAFERSAPDCPGDVDGDGDVDLADLSALLTNFGQSSGAAREDGDLDGDGDVDLADLSDLLTYFGTNCA